MEGVPRISMMSFPLRKSADSPNFRHKLKSFIREHYTEDGESYSTEINDLESLRAGAIHVSKDFSGCSTLKKYFCQLNFLKSRFPLQEGGLCAVSFSWYDVYSETVHGWTDIDFEMSCILYNIGALHSELGATDNRQSADGMKNACTHFQCAAWAFQHLRHNYQKFFTPDISPDTLSIMTNISLAQAQECILEKSLIDNRKSTITAKVALQIVEYYQLALKTIDQMLKDASQYSDKVIKAVKKWRKLVDLKAHYYACLSLLYRGMQAEDENKWGERVTFYKASLDKLTEAIKSAKSMEKTDNVHDTLQFTFDVVQGKVAISEKENEFVYHEKVPDLNAVASEIKGVSLVKGIPFKFDDPQIAGPDIFGRLVPMEAHEASSLYSEEKAKLLRNYSSKIEEKNEALDKMLIALQLDQLDLHSQSKQVPQELLDCCASLSVNKDAVKKLSELMSKLSGMYHDVDGNLGEIQQLLQEDEKKDKEYQEIVGKRPPSNVTTEISREVHKYQNAHSVAAETNQTLHETLSKHVTNLNILMKPFDEVIKYIPSLEEEGDMDIEAINQMKRLIGKVDEMRKQRIMLEQQLRDSIHSDDITKQLVVKKDQDLETVFQEELQKHDKITQILDQNLLAQENIIRALTEANANYAETRKATVHVMKKRDKAIEELISSYESYDDLLAKCNKGIEFYTKLDSNVQKLLQRVRGVCKVQEEERETSLKSLMKKAQVPPMPPMMNNSNTPGLGSYVPSQGIPPEMSMPSSSSVGGGGGPLKLKDYLAMRKSGGGQKVPNSVANTTDVNLQPNNQFEFSQQQNQNPHLSQQQQQQQIASQEYYNNPMGYPNTSQTIQNYAHPSNVSSYPNPKGTTNEMGVRPAPVGSEDLDKNKPNSCNYSGNYSSQAPQSQIVQYPNTPTQSATAPPPQFNNAYANYPTSVSYQPPAQPHNHNQQFYPPQQPQQQNQNVRNNVGVNSNSTYVNSQQRNSIDYSNNQHQGQQGQNSSGQYAQYPSYQSTYMASNGHTNTAYSYPHYSSGFHSSGISGSMGVSMTSQSPNQVAEQSPIPPNPPVFSQQQQQYYSSQPQQEQQPSYQTNPSGGQSNSYPVGPSPAMPVNPYTTPSAYQPSGNTATATTYATGTVSSVDGSNPPNQTPTQSQGSDYVYESYLAKYVQQSQGYTAQTSSANSVYSSYGGVQNQGYSAANNIQPQHQQFTYPQGYPEQTQQPQQYNNYQVNQQTSVVAPPLQGPQYSQQPQQPQYPPSGGNYYPSPAQGQQQQISGQYYQQGPAVPAPVQSQSSVETLYQSQQGSNVGSSTTVHAMAMPQQKTSPPNNVDLLSGIDLNAPPVEPLAPIVAHHQQVSHAVEPPSSQSVPNASNQAETKTSAFVSASSQCEVVRETSSIPDLSQMLSNKASPSRRKPSVDLFNDPLQLEKFTYEVEKFENLIEGFNKKSLNGPTNIDVKWKELVDIQNVECLKKSISVARCYPMKNRFADILPFDQTRVPLPSTKDEYINASFMNELSVSAYPMIVTQAPLSTTFSDFWQMIWHHQIELIVSLCSDVDISGSVYWPTERKDELEFGPLKIILQTKNIKQNYTERIISVTHREFKQTRVVIHLQFTQWIGHGFPESPGPIVSFVNEVKSYYLQQRNLSHPVVIHCLAGVGKSGVFCVLAAAFQEIGSGNGIPDILQIACNASEQRKGIMNDKEYLRFAYHCLLYYCQDILMKRGILSARTTFEEKPKKSGHIRHPSEDFLKDISVKRLIKSESMPMADSEETSTVLKNQNSQEKNVVTLPKISPTISSPVKNAPIISTRYSDVPSELTNLDASTFFATPKEVVTKTSPREAFEQGKGALLEKRKASLATDDDPLSNLDPLWTLKK